MAKPTLQELERKFIAADRAGDKKSAQIFANEIKKIRASEQPAAEPQPARNIMDDMALFATNPLLAGQRMMEMRGMSEAEKEQQRASERGLRREMVEGALLGGLGELQATGAGIKGAVTGEGFTPAFQRSLTASEAEASKFREQFPVSSTAAQIAGSLPTGVAGASRIAASKIGQALPRTAQTIGAGLTGAIAGGLGTQGGLGERGIGAGVGGALGTGFGAIGQFFPRVTEEAKGLLARNIPLTLGQSLGGAVKQAEEIATRAPVIGQIIRGAERRAAVGFDRVAVEDALSPIGFKPPKTASGRDLIKSAQDAIDEAYANAVPKSNLPNAQPIFKKFDEIAQGNTDLPKTQFDQLRAKFKKALDPSLFDEGLAMSGEAAHKAIKFLGKEANAFMKSGDPDKQQMARAMFDAQAFFRNELARQNPNAKDLIKVTQAFKQFQPIIKASVSAPSKGGEFTPAQLLAKQRSAREKEFAVGESAGQRLAQTAQNVMAREIPDSGTPLGAAGLLMAANPALLLPTMAGAAGAGAIYGTRAGTALGRGILTAPRVPAGMAALMPMASGQVGSLLAQ